MHASVTIMHATQPSVARYTDTDTDTDTGGLIRAVVPATALFIPTQSNPIQFDSLSLSVSFSLSVLHGLQMGTLPAPGLTLRAARHRPGQARPGEGRGPRAHTRKVAAPR